ncbi:MAG: hypothetical protein HQK79_13155 [Desulfobacterales bacterium]|nr:hypothetical protein [Desulfobacterales bacterium]MBF0397076.1 hypothetical protein [Desulfobacterales bacterium]
MKNMKPPNFKINLDDEDSENTFQNEIDTIKLARLNNRITLIAVLIPLLVAAMIFAAYLHFMEKTSKLQNSGVSEVENLNKYVNNRLSSLSLQYQTFGEAFDKKLDAITKITNSLQENFKKLDDTVSNISSSKIERKDFPEAVIQAITPVKKELGDLNKTVSDFSNHIKNIGDIYNKQKNIEGTISQFKVDIDKAVSLCSETQSNVGKIKAEINKNLNVGLKDVKVEFQDTLSKLYEDIKNKEEKITALEKRIDEKMMALEKKIAISKIQAATPSAKKNTLKAQPGQILEDDIHE